jgi:hypothetical protein
LFGKLENPSLADLVGGIQYVTLSDEEAKRQGLKSILERKAYLPLKLL